MPAAHLPIPSPDWYRDEDNTPFKGKRVPYRWPWHEQEPLRVQRAPRSSQPHESLPH
jgi:hypothetical protein